MTLTDGDIAALARQAVDRVDPTIDIAIEPADPVDPYRWESQAWRIWPLVNGHRSFPVYLDAGMTATEALDRLDAELRNHLP